MADMPIEYPPPSGELWAVWRWCDIPSQKNEGQVYLRRLRVVNTPWFSIMVHWINEPDTGRYSHDHPWNFISWVVRGAYWEEVWPTEKHFDLHLPPLQSTRRRWSLHRMSFKAAHRIVLTSADTVTLIVTGKRRRRFRFWTPEGKIPWDKMQPSEVNDVD
jgi:hypothetical protein